MLGCLIRNNSQIVVTWTLSAFGITFTNNFFICTPLCVKYPLTLVHIIRLHTAKAEVFLQEKMSIPLGLLSPSCPNSPSCSLQPKPKWHQSSAASWGHDVSTGRGRRVGGRRGCPAGRRQPRLPWPPPALIPPPLPATPLRLRIRVDPGKSPVKHDENFFFSKAKLP